ncbi:hypothetical protein MMYC01_201086 [Madurella mycetomatis]|uniref:Uncharacterized protein n=1 Tax=Madurella mycetomatis TaxID=100816 RepID=A0A175WHT4_9PEZI|nr:hypothetical protein MMYC01_201086 [Madurella mycetomatis]
MGKLETEARKRAVDGTLLRNRLLPGTGRKLRRGWAPATGVGDGNVVHRRIHLRHFSSRPNEKGIVVTASQALERLTYNELIDLDWLPMWLSRQYSEIPPNLWALSVHGEPISDGQAFQVLLGLVAVYARENRGFSVDDVIEHLQTTARFDGAGEATIDAKRLLVFAILGWQTMVFQPAFNVCSQHELAVHHDDGAPDSGLVFDSYKVPSDLCDRPLFVLLKSFGNLLPARSSNTCAVAVENSKAAPSWTGMYPTELNAYNLHTLLQVQFRWVDTLALHLDYDTSTRTLSLFRFPSICASQLLKGQQQQETASDSDWTGTIFSFASAEMAMSAVDPRADEDDIAEFLREVLLSFRLLFGQSVKSRKLFRQVFTPAVAPFPQPDTLLGYLCTERQLPTTLAPASNWMPKDKSAYYAARDFPVLYRRVELIARELERSRPRSVGGLLRDRRDTLQFWTFWLVAVFGAVSIALSMIQVILQGIQIAQEAGRV